MESHTLLASHYIYLSDLDDLVEIFDVDSGKNPTEAEEFKALCEHLDTQ